MARALRVSANEGLQPKLGAVAQSVRAGDAWTGCRMAVTGLVPDANEVSALPDGFKASMVLKAYAAAGAATGELAYVTGGAPAAGEISTTPDGNLVTNAADAVTSLEAAYMTYDGQVVTDVVTVTASVATFNASRAAYALISATVDAGVIPGAKTVVARGTAAPAAGQVAVQDDPTTVNFNAADVVNGSATLVYVAQGGVGNGVAGTLKDRLEAQVDF